MVVYLFLGIALAVGIYLLAQGFVRARPKQVAEALKLSALGVTAGLILFMVVAGRLNWALYLLPALLPWLLRLRAMRQLYRSARSPSKGQSSAVETPSLAMELDHDTGEMDGTVTAGPFEGRRLSEMDAVLQIDLYRWCEANDEQGARLLEAYLDRMLGAEWREQAGPTAGETRPPPSSSGMTVEEAYSILGLEPGADAEAIRAAHRRLMRHAHPDRGGSAYLAAKINAAKDLLLEQV